jgi:hypothetical protein
MLAKKEQKIWNRNKANGSDHTGSKKKQRKCSSIIFFFSNLQKKKTGLVFMQKLLGSSKI